MRASANPRRAFTLIEMVVVLVVLGLAMAIVGPAMMLPPRLPDTQRVVDWSRNIAIRQAAQVSLTIDTSGKWSVRSARSPDVLIQSGRVENKHQSLDIQISPLGLCSTESPDSRVVLNVFTCAISETESR